MCETTTQELSQNKPNVWLLHVDNNFIVWYHGAEKVKSL